MIGRVRESRNPKKVIRVALMESYGEIGRVPVNLYLLYITLQDLVNLFLAPNHKMCRGSRGLPPSCRGAGMLPQASLLYFDDMDIRQLIVRLPGDDIGKQGDIRILQPLGGRGDGDVDAVVGHVSNAIGVPLGDN